MKQNFLTFNKSVGLQSAAATAPATTPDIIL
jgi:hypothetical protein